MSKIKEKKKQKNAATTAATDNNNNDGDDAALKAQLDKAEKAVWTAYAQTLTLHGWWKTHLFRMALLVVVLTFHQSTQPTKQCIDTIKSWNRYTSSINGNHSLLIVGFEAVQRIVTNSFPELGSILLISFLTIFLHQLQQQQQQQENDNSNSNSSSSRSQQKQKQPRIFSDWKFATSSILSPMIVASYFHLKNDSNHDNGQVLLRCVTAEERLQVATTTTTTTTTNDGTSSWIAPYENDDNDNDDAALPYYIRQFSIAVLYHTIVTLILFFMQYQQQLRERDITAVQDLRRKLERAQELTKTTKGGNNNKKNKTGTNKKSNDTTTSTSTTITTTETAVSSNNSSSSRGQRSKSTKVDPAEKKAQ